MPVLAASDWTQVLIGSAGVAVGAILTGVVTYALERRKELWKLRAAERAVVKELKDADVALGIVQDEQRLWDTGKGPSQDAWKVHSDELRQRLPERAMKRVEDAEEAVEDLVSGAAAPAPAAPGAAAPAPAAPGAAVAPAPSTTDQLFINQVPSTRDRVSKARKTLNWRLAARQVIFWLAVSATFLLIAAGVGVVVSTADRGPSVSADSLAEALRGRLPGADLASCDRVAKEPHTWTCHVVYERGQCHRIALSKPVAVASLDIAQAATARCDVTAEDEYRLRISEACFAAIRLNRKLIASASKGERKAGAVPKPLTVADCLE